MSRSSTDRRPNSFSSSAPRLIRRAGVLIVVDDIRRSDAAGQASGAIERFCRGWHVNTLLDRDELQAIADQAGFAHEWTRDLTPMIEIGRLRDRAIDRLATVLGWLRMEGGRFGYLVGGSALQRCLARGWIGYDFTVFRRT